MAAMPVLIRLLKDKIQRFAKLSPASDRDIEHASGLSYIEELKGIVGRTRRGREGCAAGGIVSRGSMGIGLVRATCPVGCMWDGL